MNKPRIPKRFGGEKTHHTKRFFTEMISVFDKMQVVIVEDTNVFNDSANTDWGVVYVID